MVRYFLKPFFSDDLSRHVNLSRYVNLSLHLLYLSSLSLFLSIFVCLSSFPSIIFLSFYLSQSISLLQRFISSDVRSRPLERLSLCGRSPRRASEAGGIVSSIRSLLPTQALSRQTQASRHSETKVATTRTTVQTDDGWQRQNDDDEADEIREE